MQGKADKNGDVVVAVRKEGSGESAQRLSSLSGECLPGVGCLLTWHICIGTVTLFDEYCRKCVIYVKLIIMYYLVEIYYCLYLLSPRKWNRIPIPRGLHLLLIPLQRRTEFLFFP